MHATIPKHGKTSIISHQNSGIFDQLPNPMQVMRYHSLILENAPSCMEGLAYTKNQELMAMQHKKYPLTGIQFHPESILTQHGLMMIKNWIFS